MCDPTSLAVAGLALSAGGAYQTYSSGQSAASAAEQAQSDSLAAQNTAFQSRLSAKQQQMADQTAVNDASATAFQKTQAATQAAQTADLAARQSAVDTVNQQTQADSGSVNQAIKTGVAATTAPALAGAQVAQVTDQNSRFSPVVNAIAAGNPVASNSGSSTVTNDAMAAGSRAAAKYVGQYAGNQADLTGYSAPITLANQTAENMGTNLMPAAAMDSLVKTGAPAILAPSSLAYTQAGAYGGAALNANQLLTQNATTLAATKAGNAVDLANLAQSDTSNAIQSSLNVAQATDAAAAGLGTAISSIGNLGLTYAGSRGAFANLFSPATPAPPTTTPTPKIS